MPEEPLYLIDDTPAGKSPTKSKTLYVAGVIMAVGVYLMASSDFQTLIEAIAPEYYGVTLAAIGLIVGILRVVTSEPLVITTQKDNAPPK